MEMKCCNSGILSFFWILLAGLFFTSIVFAADEFPGRKLYPGIKTINKEALYEKIKNDAVIVVDVRSSYAYSTLKILNAKHIPVSSKAFGKQLQELRASSAKEIVFYCNGRTCHKSYKAGIKALKYNVKNCLSYDAGVFEWVKQYPEYSVLLDQTPVKKESLISNQDFKAHLISPVEFDDYAANTDSIIVDLRDREQRRGDGGMFMFRDKHVDLDNSEKLDEIIQQAKDVDETVLFYDQKGKQVRWLQYYLQNQGLEYYYFMRGGAVAYYEKLRKDQS
jgi:rhodanese-related sulfurtransferase